MASVAAPSAMLKEGRCQRNEPANFLEKIGGNLLPKFMRNPILDPPHNDPRYVAVLRKLNLAP